MSFKEALDFTLKWEGGYSNHPMDGGGATNFGITQATYNRFRMGKNLTPQDVLSITPVEVEDIYRAMFWEPLQCDSRERKFAIALFDWGVNSGVRRVLFKSEGITDYRELCGIRREYFRSIAQGKNKVFLKGWMNRLDNLLSYLQEL